MTNDPYVRYWMVDSFNGLERYKVSQRRSGAFSCSCPSWKFKKAPKADCKHIKHVQKNLLSEGTLSPAGQQVMQDIRVTVNVGGSLKALDDMLTTITGHAPAAFVPPPEVSQKPVLDRPTRKFRLEEE